MKLLILGGNGYIGSKVAREAVNAGHFVVCTRRKNSNLCRLEDICNRIKWIPASVDSIMVVMQYTSFDCVLNLACSYGKDGMLYSNVISANLEFPLEVLNTVVARGTKRFLTIGTGLPDELNMYSFSKKMLNEFGRFYVEKHDIAFYSLSLEMFYGADEPETRFLPSLVLKMIRGETVETTIGTQRRDIIYSDDVVKAIMMVFNSNLRGYHEKPVGTGEAPTISEIVDFIWKETGEKSKIRKGVVPLRDNEPDCVADTTLLKTLGNWNPVSWKSGIRKMIRTMEERQ